MAAGTPGIPQTGMFVTVIEYFQPVAASRHADTPTEDEAVRTEQAPHTPLKWT